MSPHELYITISRKGLWKEAHHKKSNEKLCWPARACLSFPPTPENMCYLARNVMKWSQNRTLQRNAKHFACTPCRCCTILSDTRCAKTGIPLSKAADAIFVQKKHTHAKTARAAVLSRPSHLDPWTLQDDSDALLSPVGAGRDERGQVRV